MSEFSNITKCKRISNAKSVQSLTSYPDWASGSPREFKENKLIVFPDGLDQSFFSMKKNEFSDRLHEYEAKELN